MKKILIAALAVLVVAGGLTACRGKKSDGLTLKEGVLSIGMEIGYPPMEYHDANGNPVGFDVSMGKAIAEKLGLKAEFIDVGWDGIFSSVDTDRFDAIMSSVTITPERVNAHNFSKPYIANTLAMVLRKDSAITAQSPEECVGMDITFQSDTTADFYMQRLAAAGLNFTPRGYEKVMYCFNEMALGRVDVIVTDSLVAFEYTSPVDSPFVIVWLGSENPEVFGICMKKGNDALTDAVNKALEDLFDDGTMLEISNQIFGMDLVTEARNQW